MFTISQKAQLIIVASIVALTAIGAGSFNYFVDASETIRKAPSFSFVTNQGTYYMEEFQGSPLVLHFWSTSCETCLEQMRALQKLHTEGGGELNVVGIHRSTLEPYSEALTFASENNISYLQVEDYTGSIFDVFSRGQYTVPTTVIIDSNGFIVETIVGSWQRSIDEYLSENVAMQ